MVRKDESMLYCLSGIDEYALVNLFVTASWVAHCRKWETARGKPKNGRLQETVKTFRSRGTKVKNGRLRETVKNRGSRETKVKRRRGRDDAEETT